MINSRSVSVTEEKRIITALITSDKFTKEILPIIDLDYFVNSYLKILASWAIAFYEEHNRSPNIHIKDIYESESHRIKETDAELISDLLGLLSDQYDPDSVNVEYLKDCAVGYFRRRELEIVVNNVSVLKDKEEYDEAEQQIEKFTKVALELDSGSLINIGDVNQVIEIYEEREKEDKNFFQLPGDLGRYLGPFKRGDLIGYYAPAKRGKCKSENSLVYLSDGRVLPIKEVVRLGIRYILCMNKDNKIVNGEIDDWMYSGEKTEYEITVKSGRKDKSSEDHKYYTPTGWKRLKDLKIGDRIAMAKYLPNFSTKTIASSKVRILAYLIADGHLGSIEYRSLISFTKQNPEIMQDFINNLPKSDTYRIDEGCIYLHKGIVSKFINSIGLINKLSGDKFIPDIIMQSNNKIIAEFLNILFTCDGSVCIDKKCVTIGYSTKSKLLSDQILCCLSRFRIFGKLREKIVNGTIYYEILLSSNQAIIDFMNHIGFSFHKSKKAKELTKGIIAKRDYIDCIPKEFVKEIGDSIVERGIGFKNYTFKQAYDKKRHTSRYTLKKTVESNHPLLNNDILWDSIESIEKKGKVKMYDLSAKDNHNFIADGFIVHNSFTLVDHFKHLVLQKKKTIFWSIEMTRTEITPRIMKAFHPMIEEAGVYSFPTFDCIKNQAGECVDRASKVIVLDGDELIEDPNHVPCTKCMRGGKHDFTMTIYYDKIYREQDDIFTVTDMLSGTKRAPGISSLLGRCGRLSVHKKYTLSYDKMMRDIEVLHAQDGFIPDAFVLDYVDILDIGSKFDDYRAVDEAWKLLARVAGEFNALMITATQANKEGHKAANLDASHQSGFYGKNQHVNMMIGLNQTPEEKEQGVIKYGITEARSQHYIQGKTCCVLQDIKAGQVYLDSYYKY